MKCVRDRVEGLLHATGEKRGTLAACNAGFAQSGLERVDDAIPTCLWCTIGVDSPLRYWGLLPEDDMRRRYIEGK